MLSLLAKVIDVLLYVIAGIAAFYLQFHSFHFSLIYKIAFFTALLLVSPIFSTFGVYHSLRGRSFLSYARSLYSAQIALMIILASIAFITKTGEYFSRHWFILWNLSAAILLTLFRLGLRRILHVMRRQGFNQKRVIIIGSAAEVAPLITQVHRSLWSGFAIVGVLDDSINDSQQVVADVMVRKLPDNLGEYIAVNKIAEVWLLSSAWDKNKINHVIQSLQQSVVAIRYFPVIFGVELINHSVSEFFSQPVINIVASPMTGMNRLVKAAEDRILSALILLIISPVMLFIAILVKLSSPGPIFYRQLRHGWDGKPIWVYKFRSMKVHHESNGVVTQAKANDSRVTAIGKLLRKTSLDELPQFINVLQGTMSIVGPRPHALEHNEQYKRLITSYMQRHQVKPGITGWAQINGWRGETETLDKMQKRVEFDLYYINHWSLWFDLKIILLTIIRGFIHRNAY